ncbi:hypothetical protein JNX00_14230 [Hydrogenophaga sp. YM1]|uniref:choice-of-anchor Q domain-containing protein n=1 Tax=Hydrogenophaga sp. YM1 TaxID=2806262 RepID=UPI001959774F|nr:choice-of-anchor Q domain-containing protein [Hydrogenophaga sp. YM1]QRR32822.1 hypothetical protein JNX00_14230 [Hydrogenophaga sp. YM1]
MKFTFPTLRRGLAVPRMDGRKICGALLTALTVSTAMSATITVDPTAADDANAGDGKCSLREAVMSINAGGSMGDCVADVTQAFGTNDTIVMPAGTYTLSRQGIDETYSDADPGSPASVPVVVNTPDASRGDLDLQKSLRLVGAGGGATVIQWDAALVGDRVLHVVADTGTVDVVLDGVDVRGGTPREVDIKAGPASTSGSLETRYYLRRAGGGIAVGPAASIVLVDPNVTGSTNSGGRGGSKRPGGGEESGATYSLKLNGVTVYDNNAQGDGGGIYTAGAMTMTRSTVRNNVGSTNGGGIYNEGNTTLLESTVRDNKAEGGGGLFATGSNTVGIAGSTFNGNEAVGGGAISARAGVTLKIVNTTISGNKGTDVGGGLYTNGSAQLLFVTITNNLAGADSSNAGSGINLFPSSSGGSTVSLKNVMLSGNRKGWTVGMDDTAIAALPSANCGVTGSGLPVSSQASNLSSDASCDTWLTSTSDKKAIDPRIGVLTDNGGPTLTHALLDGSPALGAGTADTEALKDQRGIQRDATPDIGAFESPTVAAPTPESTVVDEGGGCTMANGRRPIDPVLPMVAMLAVLALLLRQRLRPARNR